MRSFLVGLALVALLAPAVSLAADDDLPPDAERETRDDFPPEPDALERWGPALEYEWEGGRMLIDPPSGLRLWQEPDELELHLGGVLAVDYYGYDPRNSRDSGVRVDRAVVRLEGSWRDLSWRLAPDLKGIDTHGGFEEAWVAYEPFRFLRASAGLQRIPLTMEHTIWEEDLSFIGRAFTAYLDGRTDIAARLEGEVYEGLFSYDLAATAGEGFTPLGERVTGYQLSARTVIYPLRSLEPSLEIPSIDYEIPLLSGLFFHFAYAYTIDFEGPLEVANPFRNKLFFVSRLDTSGSDFYHIGYGWDLGPFRFTHEWVRGGYSDVELPGGGEENLDDQVTAWSAAFSWMVTGEPYDSRPFRARRGRPGPFPRRPLWGDDTRAGFGALELAVRYSNSDIDRDFFELGFTDFNTSSQEFRTFSGAINWYPAHNLRASIQVVRTIADQFPQTFDSHGRDTSIAVRLQYSF